MPPLTAGKFGLSCIRGFSWCHCSCSCLVPSSPNYANDGPGAKEAVRPSHNPIYPIDVVEKKAPKDQEEGTSVVFVTTIPPFVRRCSTRRRSRSLARRLIDARTCGARPSFELSLLLLMIFSIKPATDHPIAGAATLAQRSHRHCEQVHRLHRNPTFRDGRHKIFDFRRT